MSEAAKKAVQEVNGQTSSNHRSQSQQPKSQPVDDFFISEISPARAAAILAANKDQMEFNNYYVGQLMNGSRTTLVEAATRVQEQQNLELEIRQETKKLAESDPVSIEQMVKQAAQERLKERQRQIQQLAERESQKIIPINVQEVEVFPLISGGAVAALNGSR